MKSPICDMLGIEFPLLAFSHCRDVVAAVSRAGGFGVLVGQARPSAARMRLENVQAVFDWLSAAVSRSGAV